MIDVFYGEFTFVPEAINIGLNRCAHACCYCFANGKKGCRESALGRIRKLVDSEPGERADALAQLYHADYPVSMCNETDVLSPNNVREAFAVLRLLDRRNTPVLALTKGGAREDEDELIARLAAKRNSILYVSVTCAEDDVCRKVEPGANPTSARMDLLRRARAAGVPCICALNPLWEEWMPEESAMGIMRQCMDMGISMFLLHALHLSAAQRKAGVLDANGLAVLRSGAQFDYVNRLTFRAIAELGADAYQPGCPFPRTEYFNKQGAIFGKRMPVLHDFIQYASAKQRASHTRVFFRFEEFERALMSGREELYGFNLDFSRTVLSMNMAAFRENPMLQRKVSVSRFLRSLWNDKRYRFFSPSANLGFQMVVCGDGKPLRDEHGDIVLCRDGEPHGADDRTVIVEEKEVFNDVQRHS